MRIGSSTDALVRSLSFELPPSLPEQIQETSYCGPLEKSQSNPSLETLLTNPSVSRSWPSLPTQTSKKDEWIYLRNNLNAWCEAAYDTEERNNRDYLSRVLDAWCANAYSTAEEAARQIEEEDSNNTEKGEYENRRLAAQRILLCYETQSLELDLWNLKLTELPEAIGSLTSLQQLNLSSNEFSSLPNSIKNLKQLRVLDVSDNQLTTIPDLQNLEQLQMINLSGNMFSTLPHRNWNFKWLKTLNLSNNSITVLPRSMFALPASCTIDLNQCPLSRVTYEALQRRQSARPCLLLPPNPPRHYDESTLQELIDELYLLSDKSRPDLPNLFSSPEREHLHYFLYALRETVHFDQGGDLQVALATLIIDYLELAERDAGYRNLFFPMIEEAKTTCGDKVVLYAIYLGVQKQLLEADLTDLPNLAALLTRGVWALDQLRDIAENKIAVLRLTNPEYEEEVQVHLGYLVFLKERLQLPIDLGNMRFLCDVTDSDCDDAYRLVTNTLENLNLRDEFLVLDRFWRTALETTYPEKFRAAMATDDCVKAVASLTRTILDNQLPSEL